MAYDFPIVTFLWLLIYLFKEEKKVEVSKPQPPNLLMEKHPIWKVHYFSNDKLLSNRHVFYYLDVLELTEAHAITPEIIDESALQHSVMLKRSEDSVHANLSVEAISAAQGYLIDRWMYISSLN